MVGEQDRWKSKTVRQKVPCDFDLVVIFDYENESTDLGNGEKIFPVHQTHIFLDTDEERDKIFERIRKYKDEVNHIDDNYKLKQKTFEIIDKYEGELSQNHLCRICMFEGVSRLISEILKNQKCSKCGNTIHTIHSVIKELKHLRCHKPQPLSKRKVHSCLDGLANSLFREQYVKENQDGKEEKMVDENEDNT